MPVLLLITFLFFPSALRANEAITWYAYDQPPASIFNGPYKGLGFINKSQKLLINALSQYEHNEVQVSVGRFLHDLKLKKKVCIFGLGKTPERSKYVTYSNTALIHRNIHVLIKKEKAAKHLLSKSINLIDLFEKHNFSTSIVDGRFYGKTIDSILAKHQNNVLIRSSSADRALYKMLELNRFDFLLTFPSSANYAIETGLISADFELLKIKHIPAFMKTGIGCSKSEWGERVVIDINKALKEISSKPTYFEALSFWMKDEQDIQAFHNFFKREVLDSYK